MKKSFTLIELLIVLVIVGILATLAVPQYKLIVIKAAGAEAMTNLRALSDSLWRYYLEAGSFPSNGPPPSNIPVDLDVKILPETKYFDYGYTPRPSIDGFDIFAMHQGLSFPGNIPAGAIVGYEIRICNLTSMDIGGYIIQGEKVADNLYRYFLHWYMQPDSMRREKPGWPGGK